MYYFKLNAALEVVAVSADLPEECRKPGCWARNPADGSFGAGWCSRWDWSDHPVSPRMFAQQLADSASKLGQGPFMVSDNGPSCSPRFDVVRAPQVGDVVSKGFNGDAYPVGKIASISKGEMKLITVVAEDGRKLKFYRKGERAAWVQTGGTWSLMFGTHNDRNPSF